MVNSHNTEEIIAVMTAEIEEWARALDKQKNNRTGRSELQEKMETKINEVWPYGPGEVHGPLSDDCSISAGGAIIGNRYLSRYRVYTSLNSSIGKIKPSYVFTAHGSTNPLAIKAGKSFSHLATASK